MKKSLKKGVALYRERELGNAWHIISGAIQFETANTDGNPVTQLAITGDVIGLEAMCDLEHTETAIALTECVIERVTYSGNLKQLALLTQAYFQQQRRLKDMARLRTGTVKSRIQHFLTLFAASKECQLTELSRTDLPTLKEIATIVDTAPETVCRELNKFLPVRHTKTPQAFSNLATA